MYVVFHNEVALVQFVRSENAEPADRTPKKADAAARLCSAACACCKLLPFLLQKVSLVSFFVVYHSSFPRRMDSWVVGQFTFWYTVYEVCFVWAELISRPVFV